MLSVTIKSIMLSVVMLSVVMLNVVASYGCKLEFPFNSSFVSWMHLKLAPLAFLTKFQKMK